MNWPRSRKTVAVHSGNFHADEIFSVATLALYLKRNPKIIRTRDEKIYSRADYVLDVGGEYDPARNRFDHHQFGGAGQRANGIPYATFGVIWKAFGEKISGSKEAAEIIEKKLVMAIDADDNALEACNSFICEVRPYTISDCIIYRNSLCTEKDSDQVFEKLMLLAKDIIKMEVIIANKFLEDHKKVEKIYNSSKDKRLIILDQEYDWNGILSDHPEPLLVVRPSPAINAWKVYGVKIKGEKFKNRIDLPQAWASKKDGELAKITGVSDAIYCHHQRYMAIVRSREGAIRLAELALQEAEKNKKI